MKNSIKIPFAAIFMCALTMVGCKKEVPVTYDGGPGIYLAGVAAGEIFRPDSTSFSFVDVNDQAYTLYLKVCAQGRLSDKDRRFVLKEVATTPADKQYERAVAGTDFVSLESPQMQQYFVIPANKAEVLVPLQFIRNDKLKTKRVELQLELQANDEFSLGLLARRDYKVKFADLPTKPSNWDAWSAYFGSTWGPEKHRFILKVCGTVLWDEVGYTYYRPVAEYFRSRCRSELEKYNKENPEPLKEADGTIVTFY